jgi:hypothetical protein
MNPAWTIAAALDRHLSAKTEIVVFGSAALLLDHRFAERLQGRLTNDIDIIIPASRELAFDTDMEFWQAVEATNKELEREGLYVSHIFPEREVVLSSDWIQHLQVVATPFKNLTIRRPQLLDLILSKMGRADAQDLEDVTNMIRLEYAVFSQTVSPEKIAAAAATANVPVAYLDIFPAARDRVVATVQEAVSRL